MELGARPCRPHVAKTRRNAPRRAQHVHKEAQSLRRTVQEPDFSILRQRALVGTRSRTRSRAIRRRTSKEGANVKTGGANWKSLSSDSARARWQKQQKEASRHAAPDAGAHPGAGGAARSYHFYDAAASP